jgi:VWFA-related protein
VVAVLLLSAAIAAQSPPAAQVPQFRAQADLIEVDVSVLDGNRRPVSGLTAADFSVTEDKVAQTISAFAEVQLSTPERVESAWRRSVPRDVESNRLGDRRLIVLFLDDTKGMDPLTIRTAKKMAHVTIDHLGPDDLAAVVYAANQRLSQDFTGDRARLHAAVDRFDFSYGTRPLFTLNLILDSLATVTNRRKTVFYISLGEFFDRNNLGPMRDIYGDPQGPQRVLLHEMQEVFRKARLGNVNVYTVDPSGLKAPATALALRPGEQQREFMQIIAGETGGRALVNTNAPDRDVPAIFRENSTYYLLGYRSTNEAADGKFRRIQVRMNRRGLTARARSGYYARTTAETSAARAGVGASGRVGQVLAGLVPNPDLPMSLTALPFARTDAAGGSLGLVVGIEPPTAAAEASESVSVLMSVFTPEGAPRGSRSLTVSLVPEAGAGERIRLQAFGRFELPAGPYRVRAAANLPGRGLSGSVFTDVTIPDFGSEPLAMSGVAIEAKPPIRSVPANLFDDLTPLMPTVEREFGRLAPVDAHFTIHQGGSNPLAPVQVAVEIRNAQDQPVFGTQRAIAPDEFSDRRSAPVQFALPIDKLLAGPHLLRIVATIGGRGVHRDVPFGVR